MIAPLSSEKRNRPCNIYHHSDRFACWHAGTFACWYVGISSCFPTAVGLAVRNNRHEYRLFSFRPCIILSNNALRTFAAPNSSQISHSVMAVAPISFGRKILPCSSIVIIFLSSFIGILFLIKWLGRYSSPYPPTCATRFPCLGLSSGR